MQFAEHRSDDDKQQWETTEPPSAPGQEEWERWFSHFSPRDNSSETVERVRILRAEHHAEAWRIMAEGMDGRATIADHRTAMANMCAWRKIAEELSR